MKALVALTLICQMHGAEDSTVSVRFTDFGKPTTQAELRLPATGETRTALCDRIDGKDAYDSAYACPFGPLPADSASVDKAPYDVYAYSHGKSAPHDANVQKKGDLFTYGLTCRPATP